MTALNNVNIEESTVNVEEYTTTNAALAALREKYQVVPDVNTDEGYAFVKDGIKELTGLRTKLEAARKREKEPYLQAGRIIDAEAKRITEQLVQLEDPMKAAKKEVDDRIERERQARIARLQAKVDAIIAMPASVRGKSSTEISDMLDRVGEIDATHDFYDLTKEAIAARDTAMDELTRMLTERLAFEASEAERRKLEAEQAELHRQQEEMRQKLAEQQAELARQQEEMRQQQEAMERQQEEMRRQREAMERASAALVEPVPEPVAASPETEQEATPEPIAPVSAPAPVQIVPQVVAPIAETEMVTITRAEYDELLCAKAMLDALIAAGAADWEGWHVAKAIAHAA